MTKNHPSKNQGETWTDCLSKDNDTQVTKQRERCLMGNRSHQVKEKHSETPPYSCQDR